MFEEQRSHLFVWIAAAVLVAALGYRVLASRTPPPPPVTVGDAGAPARAGSGSQDGTRTGRSASGPRAYVHVAGAVRRPGLYRVPAGARIATAIELAGGPRRRADLTTVNLAAKIEDGQQIVVPVRGTAPAATAPVAGAGVVSAAPISLASATQAQLEELDGIGPALAQAILEYRDAHGGFRSIEELQEVDGIGEKRFEALRDAVRP